MDDPEHESVCVMPVKKVSPRMMRMTGTALVMMMTVVGPVVDGEFVVGCPRVRPSRLANLSPRHAPIFVSTLRSYSTATQTYQR